jgi:dTDP-D-glucose 4,6-dehydratase
MQKILGTGGAGFIGSNFVLDWLAQSDEPVINLNALTYADNLENLASLSGDPRHHREAPGAQGRLSVRDRLPPRLDHARTT